VYARLLVRGREDAHYLLVGRVLTLVVIGCSFGYVPFVLEEGMLFFYLKMVGAFVVPLLTIYLVGGFTRASRKSGAVGLVAGVTYGIARLLAEPIAVNYGVAIMAPWLADPIVAYPMSMLITAGAMLVTTAAEGPVPPGELVHQEQHGWLRASQIAARQATDSPIAVEPQSRALKLLPSVLGLIIIAVGMTLAFWVFW
jgi:hypothetical protein